MRAEQVRLKRVRRKKLLPIGMSSSNAGRYIGISEAMMRKMRSLGSGPVYKTIGRKIVYMRRDLQAWLEKQ